MAVVREEPVACVDVLTCPGLVPDVLSRGGSRTRLLAALTHLCAAKPIWWQLGSVAHAPLGGFTCALVGRRSLQVGYQCRQIVDRCASAP